MTLLPRTSTPANCMAPTLALLALPGLARGAQVEEPALLPAEQSEARAPEPLPRTLAPFQADWGLGAVMRSAQIPYKTENESVSSFVPLMFYEGEHVFVRGMSAGVHAWSDEQSELNLLTRLRFVDIPREFQNQIQGDTLDFGLQYHRDAGPGWWETEILSDSDGEWQVAGRVGGSVVLGKLLFSPTLEARYLSGGFATRYFALTPVTGQAADAAFQLSPGVLGRYHLFSDVYLLGSLRYTWYSSEITGLDAIDTSGVAEATVGFGFFQDAGDPQFLGQPAQRATSKKALEAKPYVRLAHGWATPSNLGDILGGTIEDDEFDNQMTSVFYGHPLTDRLFGAPIEVYLSPGLAWHHASSVQANSQELVLKIKAYYTIHWPIRWRLGVAEGVSWINNVTYIEKTDLDEKGYRESQWMNYLDFSLDLNVGELVHVESMRRLWAGVAIHHRSSIFESASQFGRIKGGSNYPSIYLQYDLY